MDESKLPFLGANVLVKTERPCVLLGYSTEMDCALLADPGMKGRGQCFNMNDRIWSEDRWDFWRGLHDFLKKGWPDQEWGLRFERLSRIKEES